MEFRQAIVRTPGKSMVHGLTTGGLGIPNYAKAIKQHGNYIAALKECGLRVTVLDADERYPDSTFVEDVALLTPRCAIITNPGAPSRKGEVDEMKDVLRTWFTHIEEIQEPGTVEAGDIFMVGNTYYIGLSQRTNKAGVTQLIDILSNYGFRGCEVKLENVLHLKTGVAYLENNNLVACGEFITHPAFQQFNILEIDDEESYAANCVWINNYVLLPQGFPKAKETIEDAGYPTLVVDVSEFQKLDGGISCLSLRF